MGEWRGGAGSRVVLSTPQERSKRQDTLGVVAAVKTVIKCGAVAAYLVLMESLDFFYLAVPGPDVLFVLGAIAYFWGLNRFRFAVNAEAVHLPAPRLSPEPWVKYYAAFMAVIGLVLPWMILLSSPKHKILALAPHLYLLMAQVLVEKMSVSLKWAMPVRQLVPIAFNWYRLTALLRWIQLVAFARPNGLVEVWSWADKILVCANFLAWSFNLFGFLVPRVLPQLYSAVHRPWATPDEVEAEAAELMKIAAVRRKRAADAARSASAAPMVSRATSSSSRGGGGV